MQDLFGNPEDRFSRDTAQKLKIAGYQEEYYHFLAEKIYKIQKELEEKRLQRREQQKASGVPPDNKGIRMPNALNPSAVRPTLSKLPNCFTSSLLHVYMSFLKKIYWNLFCCVLPGAVLFA